MIQRIQTISIKIFKSLNLLEGLLEGWRRARSIIMLPIPNPRQTKIKEDTQIIKTKMVNSNKTKVKKSDNYHILRTKPKLKMHREEEAQEASERAEGQRSAITIITCWTTIRHRIIEKARTNLSTTVASKMVRWEWNSIQLQPRLPWLEGATALRINSTTGIKTQATSCTSQMTQATVPWATAWIMWRGWWAIKCRETSRWIIKARLLTQGSRLRVRKGFNRRIPKEETTSKCTKEAAHLEVPDIRIWTLSKTTLRIVQAMEDLIRWALWANTISSNNKLSCKTNSNVTNVAWWTKTSWLRRMDTPDITRRHVRARTGSPLESTMMR